MAKDKKKKPKDEESDGAPVKSGPGLISTLITAVALGGASFATVYLLPGQAPPLTVVEVAPADHVADPLDGIIPGPRDIHYVTLDDITVSLSEPGRILKIGLSLEVLNTGDMDIDPDTPAIKDAFTGYLRSLRMEQIQDPTFMVRMRAHLLRRAQLVYDSDRIYSVLITDFLVR